MLIVKAEGNCVINYHLLRNNLMNIRICDSLCTCVRKKYTTKLPRLCKHSDLGKEFGCEAKIPQKTAVPLHTSLKGWKG